MIRVHVECYAGFKGSERPLRFTLGSRVTEVEAVEDQWHSPDVTYFRIRAVDGNRCILKHNESQDQWSVELYASNQTSFQLTGSDFQSCQLFSFHTKT